VSVVAQSRLICVPAGLGGFVRGAGGDLLYDRPPARAILDASSSGLVFGVMGISDAAGGAGGETRWLDEEERAAWLAVVAMMLRLPPELDSQLASSAGLTFFEYLLLARLAEQPDRRVQMRRLAVLTNGSLSRLSHVASRLEQRGLLRRARATKGPRYMEAILTPAGYRLVVRAAPGHVEKVRELVIDSLSSAQLRALAAAGRRVLANIDPGSAWPP
jgi:DNA-binding MarR family transcriptional regulator